MAGKRVGFTEEEALSFHARGKPGKIEINPTKPMATQRDLSLAYSPGVAVPVLAIADNPDAAYDYTAKGNFVAVVSNGTAILGLGNLGALAAKPVMEGKGALFKRFADINGIDICISATDVDDIVNCVKFLGPSFGGINLEDIKAPECFLVEKRLKELMDIPVFHDDQHGTAIICAAGLINGLHISGKDIGEIKVVVNGAGSAGIACLELVKAIGVKHDNAILCDTKGVVYKGREEGMNEWKARHAAETNARTLEEAMTGADVFMGLSAKGAVTKAMVKAMGPAPLIFAMANPDPEITPEEVAEVRDDAIVATGRSDYPNQVNNVLGFPYIFRGALDVRASSINDEMKIAAARALAELAREDVPDEVITAYGGNRLKFGRGYIIPVPFDPRLITRIPPAVARAAMETGVARRPIIDFEAYQNELSARLDPIAGSMQGIISKVQRNPKRIVFAEGEEEGVIRAAVTYRNMGLGTAILIGREDIITDLMKQMGVEARDGIEIHNARISNRNAAYAEYLYKRLQRVGQLERDCQRMVNQDRNVFGACMVALGDADGMVTGVTRNSTVALGEVRRALDASPGKVVMGVTIVVSRGKTVVVADTMVNELPDADQLAQISVQAADVARRLGFEPRVALLSYSTFGNPMGERAEKIRDAVQKLRSRDVDFEVDGDMSADVALSADLMKRLYPFSRLSGEANVLVMPAVQSASISTKMLARLGGSTLIGPLLIGLEKPVQVVPMGAGVNDLVNMAAMAAYDLAR